MMQLKRVERNNLSIQIILASFDKESVGKIYVNIALLLSLHFVRAFIVLKRLPSAKTVWHRTPRILSE